jgi:hypothetical protein
MALSMTLDFDAMYYSRDATTHDHSVQPFLCIASGAPMALADAVGDSVLLLHLLLLLLLLLLTTTTIIIIIIIALLTRHPVQVLSIELCGGVVCAKNSRVACDSRT